VLCLCEFYPAICLTTEEKARKTLSQDKKNLSQVNKNLSQCTAYILQKHSHIATHTHTHTHITKQYETTAVQIKAKCNIYPNEIEYNQSILLSQALNFAR
jgi:hypothetical protein